MAISASADIIPTFDSTASVGPNFQWNYSANATLDQRVQSGDYFTIYDFGGFVPGSNAQPMDWTFSSSLIGTTPSTVLPMDDAGVFNLTWTYIGQESIVGPNALGIFSAVSNTNQQRTDNFAASATRNGGGNDGTPVDNIGSVAVPVPEMSALAPIIGVLGLGMIGVANTIFRRRKDS